MAKNSRIPSAVGAIPVVGDLMRQADTQAQWLQEILEQNARLVSQLPATIKSFNDSLERFNQTVGQLDRVVSSIEGATAQFIGPLEQLAPKVERLVSAMDVPSLRDIPDAIDSLRREALPALRAATDTQKQVALLAATLERVLALLNDLPGAGLLRRRLAATAAPATPKASPLIPSATPATSPPVTPSTTTAGRPRSAPKPASKAPPGN